MTSSMEPVDAVRSGSTGSVLLNTLNRARHNVAHSLNDPMTRPLNVPHFTTFNFHEEKFCCSGVRLNKVTP